MRCMPLLVCFYFVSALDIDDVFHGFLLTNAVISYGTFTQLHVSCLLLHVPSMVWTERALPDMPQVRYSQAFDIALSVATSMQHIQRLLFGSLLYFSLALAVVWPRSPQRKERLCWWLEVGHATLVKVAGADTDLHFCFS
jgi:hypothetical protein